MGLQSTLGSPVWMEAYPLQQLWWHGPWYREMSKIARSKEEMGAKSKQPIAETQQLVDTEGFITPRVVQLRSTTCLLHHLWKMQIHSRLWMRKGQELWMRCWGPQSQVCQLLQRIPRMTVVVSHLPLDEYGFLEHQRAKQSIQAMRNKLVPPQ